MIDARVRASLEIQADELPSDAEAQRKAKRAAYDRNRKIEKKANRLVNLSAHERLKQMKATWLRNWKALSPAERLALNTRIGEANTADFYAADLATILRKPVLTDGPDGDLEYVANAFTDLQEIASRIPPTDDPVYLAALYHGVDSPEFLELFDEQFVLETLPPFLKTYGVPCDLVYGPSFHHAVALIRTDTRFKHLVPKVCEANQVPLDRAHTAKGTDESPRGSSTGDPQEF